MMRSVALWTTVVLLGCSQSGELQTRRADEVTLTRSAGLAFVNESLYTGRLIWYYENGDTARFEDYRQGKQHGISKVWYVNGQVKEVRHFKNNRKHGHHKGWYTDGQIAFDYHFENGVYTGTIREWYRNGQLYMLANYNSKGQEEGMQQAWKEDGELYMNYETKSGRKYGNAGIKHCKSLWSETSGDI